MTAAQDIANYWLADPEAVTVTYTTEDEQHSVTTVKAKLGDLDYREIQLGAAIGLEPSDQVWIVGAATLGGQTFERGGTITDGAGQVWVIQSFRARLAGGGIEAYRAVCRKKGT